MRTPLIVVTGVDAEAMDSVMIGLAWDLPSAVVVKHRIDPESQILTRVVSDAGGIIECEEIELAHACVTCALREDIIPTLERLARDGRWSAIVSCLPTGAEAAHLGNVLQQDTRLARKLRMACVVTSLARGDVVEDLLGEDLLSDRQAHFNPDDGRGVGEVACAMVEYADVVVLPDRPVDEAPDLVRALARPDARVVVGAANLAGQDLLDHQHRHQRTLAWASPFLAVEIPPLEASRAWRLALSSPLPFHPERLLDEIEQLGSGRHRSRGCFWLPTRPGIAQEWDGAGGQLSIGELRDWGRRTPLTRLVLTGIGAAPATLEPAFSELLVTPAEARDAGAWAVSYDGLEPWLGDIRHVA